MIFVYGISGKKQHTYTWKGTLKFGQTKNIYLPPINYMEFYNVDTNLFTVSLYSPNGQSDEYIYDNKKHQI